MEQRPKRKKRVLIAEDDADLRTIMRATLETAYEVETAAMGDEALAAIQARPPDLVILDIHIPHKNGLEICEEMRKKEKTAAIPVLFLSGHLDPWTLERAKRAGGDDFLTKPFDVADLLARVARFWPGGA